MKTITLLSIFCAASLLCTPSPASFTFHETTNTTLELTENGKSVFVYNFGMTLTPNFPKTMQRSCYLHPVYTPDGTLLTDDFNPGLKPLALDPGKSLVLKYQVILFSGNTAMPQPKKSVLANGAKLQCLARDFEFTEGPTADAQGNVFFTDQPNNRILK